MLEMDQQRLKVQAAAAQAECDARRTHEETSEQILALKGEQQKQLERILTRQALEHSSSKVAEFTSKIYTRAPTLRAEVEGEASAHVSNPKQTTSTPVIVGRTSITVHLHLNCRMEGMPCTALIDTVSTVTLVRPDILQQAGQTSQATVAITTVQLRTPYVKVDANVDLSAMKTTKTVEYTHPVKLFWPKSKCYDYLYQEAETLLRNYPVQATISFYEDSDSDDDSDSEEEEEPN
ncbi:Protein ripply2 [Acipenser ruthenus]|uniref:Protein ripply2 n=1 Tax=Acipenser ruthenus TaxID=7906 RepID=A0A444U6Z5_ACIRT|nr:Protein ripply2 [Acipenser ruthenus]